MIKEVKAGEKRAFEGGDEGDKVGVCRCGRDDGIIKFKLQLNV